MIFSCRKSNRLEFNHVLLFKEMQQSNYMYKVWQFFCSSVDFYEETYWQIQIILASCHKLKFVYDIWINLPQMSSQFPSKEFFLIFIIILYL